MEKSKENPKQTYWYTIVTNIPSYTRCESMNVGIVMGNKDNSYLKYLFLPMTSNKVRDCYTIIKGNNMIMLFI